MQNQDQDLSAGFDDTEQSGMGRALRKTILEITEARGASKSICPSEAARQYNSGLGGGPENWRKWMSETRKQATKLAIEGKIDILRKGKVISPDGPIRGVIRLRLRQTPNLS